MSDKHIIRLHESLPLPADPRVWAEIDGRALADNWRDLCDHVMKASPDTYAMAVVKADAYGHGIYPAVRALLGAGCRAFAFACAEEAAAAREIIRDEALIDPSLTAHDAVELLVLGYTPVTDVPLLATYGISTTIVSEDYARALSHAAARDGMTITCHIALDTGMSRIGLPACHDDEVAEAARTIARICTLPGLKVTGVFSHLAEADEDPAAIPEGCRTSTQYRRFAAVRAAAEATRPADTPSLVYHLCNSAAAVRFPDALPAGCQNAVRLGISLYGYGVNTVDGRPMAARPVMKLKTKVVHLHTLLPGERLGYGGTFASDTPRTIATLPVGYADGFVRAFGGALVTVHTSHGATKAPLVGRICMDQCMLDVTNLGVSVGDLVTLFGETRDELLDLASRAHTIPYEILCLITARVPRIMI